jgi:hypothetical protein
MFCAFLIAILTMGAIPGDGAQKSFTFSDSDHGWTVDFADYPIGEEDLFELGWGWENLPLEFIDLTKGLFLTGNNHSDDLFMYAKRQIGGLQPNTFYDLHYSVLIESNASSEHSVGIGGSPGSSVYFKAGASTQEPRKVAVNGYFLLNVDKGNQSEAGENALVIGDLGNSSPDPYFPKRLAHSDPLRVQSDDQGRLWIFLGTDSGFEGTTKFYIVKVDLQCEEVENF